MVFDGVVGPTKARNMTLDAQTNSYAEQQAWDRLDGTNGVPYSGHKANLWYEFVVTLEHGYCHPGGGLLVMFSGASAEQAFARMTTSHTTDGTNYFIATFADDDGDFDQGWATTSRERVPVMKIIQGATVPFHFRLQSCWHGLTACPCALQTTI